MSQDSFVLINKPVGISSSDVSIQFRNYYSRIINSKIKVGHSGTLDPAACGLLVLGIENCTRLLPYLRSDIAKKYKFQILFGVQTDTDDLDGNIIATLQVPDITNLDLEKILPRFIGKIEQTPTKFSAIRINGVRAYELARAGIDFQMPVRMVEIYSLKQISLDNYADIAGPRLSFEVECSSGLYVRTLASDIAKALGTIGIVTYLERVESDGFNLNMIESQSFEFRGIEQINIPYKLIEPSHLLSIWLNIELDYDKIDKLRNGQQLSWSTRLYERNACEYMACIGPCGKFYGMVGYKDDCTINQGGVIFPLYMVKPSNGNINYDEKRNYRKVPDQQ